MHALRWILSLAVLWLLSGCESSPVSSVPHHHVKLYIRYLSLDQSLKAEATLRPGDEDSEASPVALPGQIRLSDFGMEVRERGAGQPVYVREAKVDFPARFSLKVDLESYDPATFLLAMEPLGSFSVETDRPLSNGIAFQAEGSQLKANESLVLLLTNENNVVSTFTIKGPTEGEQHLIAPEQTRSLPPGNFQLFLVKKRVSTESRSGFVLSSTVEYFTPPAKLELEL